MCLYPSRNTSASFHVLHNINGISRYFSRVITFLVGKWNLANYFMTPTSECITAAILCCAHDVIEGRENDWSLRSFSPCFKPGYTVKVGQVCQDLRGSSVQRGEQEGTVRRPGFYSCFLAGWLCDFCSVPHSVSVSFALMKMIG